MSYQNECLLCCRDRAAFLYGGNKLWHLVHSFEEQSPGQSCLLVSVKHNRLPNSRRTDVHLLNRFFLVWFCSIPERKWHSEVFTEEEKFRTACERPRKPWSCPAIGITITFPPRCCSCWIFVRIPRSPIQSCRNQSHRIITLIGIICCCILRSTTRGFLALSSRPRWILCRWMTATVSWDIIILERGIESL